MSSKSTVSEPSFRSERSWTDAEKRLVARNLLLAVSVRDIAKQLEKRHFGGVCTVIARMRKSGELSRYLDEEWSKIKPQRPVAETMARFFRPVSDNAALPMNRQCSYPIGELHETGLLYCPAPKISGMSYCLAHTILAINARDRVRIIERLVATHGIDEKFARALIELYAKKETPPDADAGRGIE